MAPSYIHNLQREDEEEKVLGALYEAFHKAFSLQEIASAYCRSGGDLAEASEILCQLQQSDSNTVRNESNGETSCAQSDRSLSEDYAVNSTLLCNNKGQKPKKTSASLGTISSIIGKGYVRANSSKKELVQTTKPLKVEVRGSFADELGMDPELNSVPTKEHIKNKDVEDFLFSMLGDGFKLGRDVIREVLGHCGYDVKKGMEELLTISAKTLEKGKTVDYDTVHKDAGTCPNSESCLPEENYQKAPKTQRDLTGPAGLNKERSNISREVLAALFNAPDRSEEEPKRKHLEWGLNRTRVIGQKVITKPPDDIAFAPLPKVVKLPTDFEPAVDEEDTYHILRKTAKEHWDKMKECYEAAIDAYTNGEREKAVLLLEQGKGYNQMAREADEKSAREILETRKSDGQSDVPLDLHTHSAKDAVRLLKKHLHSLGNIPGFRYLKVTVNTDAEDTTKGKRKRLIIKLLERDSIKWTEEDGNPEIILVHLNDIDLSKLSFKNN